MGGVVEPAIRLCGRFEVRLEGRSVTRLMPGRQGRLVFAYLACNRGRAVTRDELIEILWPSAPPASPDDVLGALLSKLRRVLGADAIEGRRAVTLGLPADTSIDLELAEQAIGAAQDAIGAGDAYRAFDHAQTGVELLAGGFLLAHDDEWVRERRLEVEELRFRGLECLATAGRQIGGGRLAVGEAAARELIAAEPLRERGYRLLMEALAAGGEIASALQAYEQLRVQLRDELGIAPGATLRALHERLLAGGEVSDPTEEKPGEPPSPRREERKVVSVLAVELHDDPGDDDPEALRELQTRSHEALSRELERFGANIEPTTEGTVVALFGVPSAHEDDAERAVRAAAAVCDKRLVTHAAVATGELLVAPGVPGGSRAIGRAVSDAVRLAREAPRGAVLVDKATFAATQAAIGYEAGPREGRWLVRIVSDTLGAVQEHPVRTRFIGRGHELASLAGLLHSVVEERRPRLVLLLGQAGVGKSRLIDESLRRAAETANVYRSRCLSYGEGITYWPLREILWTATGIQLDDSAAAAAAKLRERISGVIDAASAERVSAALAVAAGIALAENPLADVSPTTVADEVWLAWPAFLTGLAARSPVLVVVEDLHWAEPTLLQMLERIRARSAGPLLLVVTARPEFAEGHAGWGSRPGVSQIVLEPLSDDHARELARELLPEADDRVHDHVVATSEGNPFFAEELARHLSNPDQPTVIPDTVRALLAARVDALPDTEKLAVQDASVVGRVFWATTLDAIEPRADRGETLRALENRGLVVTRPGSSLPGQTELSFRHGLIREVAYRSIPRARRARAHAAVGRWLERLAAERREEFVDLLAHHLEAASAPGDAALAWPDRPAEHEQLRADAVRALLEAGHASRRRMALAEALRFAHRAQALAATDRERLAALELEARTHHTALDGDDALTAYAAAIELARSHQDRDALARLRGGAILLCARYQGTYDVQRWRGWATSLIDEGLAAADNDNTLERGALLIGRAWAVRRWLGRGDLAKAKRDAEHAIEIASISGSSELLTTALEALAWIVFEQGFCGAGSIGQRLVKAGASSPDRGDAHESLITAAIALSWAGRFDQAASASQQAAARGAELTSHRALHAAAAQALCLAPTGQIAQLGDATSQVLELARQEGDHTCKTALVALAGRALWLHETLAEDAAQDVVELLNQLRPPTGPPMWDYMIAETLRPILGIDQTSELLDRLDPPGDRAADAILSLRARLPILALTRNPALDEALVQAHALARDACAPALAAIAEWAFAAHDAVHHTPRALERAQAAASALDEYGERYTGARLLLELATHTDADSARQLGETARERLEAIGAHASAAQARARTTDA